MPLDVDRYRPQFPVTESSIYMNHAAVSPLSRRVRDAMVGLLDELHQSGAANWEQWVRTYDAARRSLAQLLNAEPGRDRLHQEHFRRSLHFCERPRLAAGG